MSSPHTQQPSDEERRKQQAEAEAVKQKALAMLLDSEARQRLANIKMVKPDSCISRGKLFDKCGYKWKTE